MAGEKKKKIAFTKKKKPLVQQGEELAHIEDFLLKYFI